MRPLCRHPRRPRICSIAVIRVGGHPCWMNRTELDQSRRPAKAIVFAILLPVSLVLTATTNRNIGRILDLTAPSFDWIATAAIPSFLLIASLFIVLGDRHSLSWPRSEKLAQRSVAGLSVFWLSLWLGGCVLSWIATGHWTRYAYGWPAVSAFLAFGPLGEELLFRGLIFGYVRAIWPSSASPAIAVSTIAFSLHHISLHTAPHGLAVAQLLFTIPMGIVFALLRERTGSVWPGLWVHIATNLPSAI